MIGKPNNQSPSLGAKAYPADLHFVIFEQPALFAGLQIHENNTFTFGGKSHQLAIRRKGPDVSAGGRDFETAHLLLGGQIINPDRLVWTSRNQKSPLVQARFVAGPFFDSVERRKLLSGQSIP